MIVGKSSLDWITLTSFERQPMRRVADDVLRYLKAKNEVAKPSKIMQYEGNTWVHQGIFMGMANQGSREHMMIRVSGESAELALPALWRNRADIGDECVTATRVDVQLTLMSVSQESDHITSLYRSCAQAMRDGAKGANPHGSKVTLIDGDNGECTLYIGSRQSERYMRVYQKKSREGELYTRLEIECKGTVAKSLVRMLAAGEREAQRCMDSMIAKAVTMFGSATLMASFRSHIAVVSIGNTPVGSRSVSEESSTLRWLATDVHAAVGKLSASHDYRDAALSVVLGMLAHFEKGE